MSFRDTVQADINGVFMNQDEFAETHVWGDRPILCVLDNSIVERVRGNVTDVNYDSNAIEYGLFVAVDQFPDRLPQIQEQVFFDGMAMTVMSIVTEDGVMEIVLRGNRARRIT